MNGQRRLTLVGRHTGAAGSTGCPSEAKAHPLLVMNLVSIIIDNIYYVLLRGINSIAGLNCNCQQSVAAIQFIQFNPIRGGSPKP